MALVHVGGRHTGNVVRQPPAIFTGHSTGVLDSFVFSTRPPTEALKLPVIESSSDCLALRNVRAFVYSSLKQKALSKLRSSFTATTTASNNQLLVLLQSTLLSLLYFFLSLFVA